MAAGQGQVWWQATCRVVCGAACLDRRDVERRRERDDDVHAEPRREERRQELPPHEVELEVGEGVEGAAHRLLRRHPPVVAQLV